MIFNDSNYHGVADKILNGITVNSIILCCHGVSIWLSSYSTKSLKHKTFAVADHELSWTANV